MKFTAALLPYLMSCAQIPPAPAIVALSAGQGMVLDLPIAQDAEMAARWQDNQAIHNRNVPGELSGPQLLFSDPLVVVAINIASENEDLAIPPARAGQAIAATGVEHVVVHREYFTLNGLALLDSVLRKHLGPPMRDLANDIDIYAVSVDMTDLEGGAPLQPQPLSDLIDGVPGWLSMESWLRVQGGSPPPAR